MTARFVYALALALGVALAPLPADAIGGGGRSNTATAKSPGAAAFQKGIKAKDKKDWNLAIFHFHKAIAGDPKNADAQNWLGYSYRKSGDLDNAFTYYKQALALDPKHQGAHEYIGEAYLKSGNLAKAEEHLAALGKLCPGGCEALEDLAEEIEKFRSGS